MSQTSEKDIAKALVISYEKVMEGESHRGCLLVGLAQIERELGIVLRQALSAHGARADAEWMLDPKPGDRPLSNLAMRTRMAVCLGLISDEKRKLIDALRKLRNAHAHGTTHFVLTKQNLQPVLDAWPKKPNSMFFFLDDSETEWGTDDHKQSLCLIIGCIATSIRASRLIPRFISFQKLLAPLRVALSEPGGGFEEHPAIAMIDDLDEHIADLAVKFQSVTGPNEGDEPGVE